MAAATAKLANTNPIPAVTSIAQPKSATSSPKDAKRNLPAKSGNSSLKNSPAQAPAELHKTSPKQPEQPPVVPKSEAVPAEDSKPITNATQPLAPPPKPVTQQSNPSDTPDYFSGRHSTAHFSLEPNPFEQSFGNPSTETPGKFAGLPSVASLTSPAPLGPSGTPGWQLGHSLRSGPLSPAMLPGPTNPTGYFDEQFRQSFPTPNESSLRTGLTPGGGGSMFPAPSPNSQAIFNSMQSGGLATPGTLEFQRTAMNAAARSRTEAQPAGPTPQGINKQDYQPAQQANMGNQQDPFNHPDRDAVNSLYMLAQTGNRNANQFAVPPQPHEAPNAQMLQSVNRVQANNTSPTAGRGAAKQSIGSLEGSMMSENGDEDIKSPVTKGKPKKGAAAKSATKKKADDTPKGSANKRAKGNNGFANMSPPDDDMMDDDDSDDIKHEDDGIHPITGKKMTDDEKRKNFLERNRIAALKCRQRKKQWLANLQAKVEIFTSENDALSQQNQRLQDEIVNLKSLLIAHKDCAVSHQQGLGGNMMSQVLGSDFTASNANPYGMAMPQNGGQHMMQMAPSQGMQRR